MISALKGTWYRWMVDAMIVLTCVAIGAASYAFYTRFSRSNERFAQQQSFNYRLDHATDKLTCAIQKIIVSQQASLHDDKSPQRLLYVKLGFTPKQIDAIVSSVDDSTIQELATLPAHPRCR